MKLTRGNFGELLTPIHKKIFFDSYTEKPEQWSKVFKTDKMTRKEETFPHLGAFGMWDENTEGNTINEDDMHQGENAILTARRFDKGYSLTWELVQDDLYNVMKGTGVKGDAKSLGRGLRARVETNCAAILNGGFTNTGFDGVALFANTHPLIDSTGYLDNLTTGPLNDTNLKLALTLMRQQVDEAGILIQAVAKKLIVPNELEFTANALVKSSGPAGELSNDANTLPSLNPIVMDYLTSATAWFLQDPSFENLVLKWREKPWFGSQDIPKTVDKFLFGYSRWAEGYTDTRGILGSTGL